MQANINVKIGFNKNVDGADRQLPAVDITPI